MLGAVQPRQCGDARRRPEHAHAAARVLVAAHRSPGFDVTAERVDTASTYGTATLTLRVDTWTANPVVRGHYLLAPWNGTPGPNSSQLGWLHRGTGQDWAEGYRWLTSALSVALDCYLWADPDRPTIVPIVVAQRIGKPVRELPSPKPAPSGDANAFRP